MNSELWCDPKITGFQYNVFWGTIHLTKKELRINLSAHNPPEADKKFGVEGRN